MTEEEEKIYDFVFKEYDYILKNLSEDANVKEILKKCEQDYKDENYDLLHSFGHSLGLDIHEEPILSAKYETKLKNNMLVTIEPGVYLPTKFGIRIEDTVLINKNGANTLTKSGVDKSTMVILKRQ
jgi:Xaa-Pro aminopeptidase